MKFIESICFRNGSYQNLSPHQQRVNETFSRFFKGSETLKLESILPRIDLDGVYKVRIVYDGASEDVEFIEYQKRPIQTLEILASEPFDYSFKYENRDRINQLVKASNADDIIISFDGEIKDSSYANLAFWNGIEWLTPENPMLEGVKRESLLNAGKIKKALIHTSDLSAFEKVSLINAMLELGEVEIDIRNVIT